MPEFSRHETSRLPCSAERRFGWVLLYERLPRRLGRAGVATLAKAGTTAAVACLVDYRVAQARFRPGFEAQLSKPSLVAVYVAFAAGLALASAQKPGRRPPTS